MRRKIFNRGEKIFRPFTNWHKTKTDEYVFYNGVYYHPLGIVDIYLQPVIKKNTNAYSFLRCIHNGRIYFRSFNYELTKMGLSRLAGKFIREMYEDSIKRHLNITIKDEQTTPQTQDSDKALPRS